MAEDRGHNIWLGFKEGGLLRYSRGRFTRFGEPEGAPRGNISSLFVDVRGRLWIGAGGGLALVTDSGAPHPHFDLYDTTRGLSSNTVECIADDTMGRIYLGTPRGVDRLDPETGLVRQFSAADGLPYGGFASAIRDRSGAVWFGSRTGLSRIVPEPPGEPHIPNVLITALRAGDVDYPVSQLGETSVALSDLSPAKNRMQVEFTAPDASGETLRYKFRLKGADTAWSEPRVQHAVDYRNLAAGSYQLLVKAVDAEGHESANTADVTFTVLPPLWKRWWFELCLFGAATGLAYALHAYRLNNILSIEKMRTAIATDLHDDIGSSLAQIAVWSAVAQVNASGGAPMSGQPLDRIGTVARELTDSMNDIVWAIRSGDEGPESLFRRMRQFSAEFLQPAGIDFSFSVGPVPPRVRLTLNSRRQIFLIYKECMHNLVKHSGCRSAWVEFSIGDNEAVMTVADDGIGLNGYAGAGRSLASGGGNGLPNMLRRAESLGGRVEFGERVGGGCRITVWLPVRSRAFRDAML
jgi:signal transduction histidine kinase